MAWVLRLRQEFFRVEPEFKFLKDYRKITYIQTRFVIRPICRVLVLHAHEHFQIELGLGVDIGGDREEYRTKTRV